MKPSRHVLTLLGALAAGVLLTAATGLLYHQVEQAHRDALGSSLQGVLNTTHQALQTWHREHRQRVRLWADSERIRAASAELLQVQPRKDLTLLAAPARGRLKQWFTQLRGVSDYEGYFIIGPEDVTLAADREASVGFSHPLVRQPDILARAWAGESVLSLPQLSTVPLPGRNGAYRDSRSTLFAVAPVRDDSGRIQALFAFRIDPGNGLTAVLQQGRLGSSGETYAFSRGGRLLSNSRFESQLRDIGLLQAATDSALHVWIRDPGVDLTRGGQAALPGHRQPLTRMAHAAVTWGEGLDIDGYRDYRGVPVVGAWLWSDSLGLGITTEQNRDEAYYVLHRIRLALGLLLGLGLLLLAALAAGFIASGRLLEGRERAHTRDLALREERLRLALDATGQGLWEMTFDARPDFFSEQVFTQFGHPAALCERGFDALTELIHPDDRAPTLARFADMLEDNERDRFRAEFRLRGADDHWYPALWRGRCVKRDAFGRAARVLGVLADISERRRLEEALREREERATLLALVARHTDNAVLITDATGRIEWANEGFTRLAGYTLEEVRGRMPGDFLQGPDTAAEAVRLMSRRLAEGRGFQVEIINYHKSGASYWVDVNVTPIRDADGHIERFIAIESDISARKQMEQDLRERQQELGRSNAELLRAARMKDEFLATMSHELRTPLNTILALSEVLLEGPYGELNARQSRYIGSIENAGRHLLDLINDILDVSKIESGHLELEPKTVEVEELCQASLGLAKQVAAQKSLQLTYDRDPTVRQLVGDGRRLKQALVNLLSNAVKFTPAGKAIGLSVSADGDRAVFQVWDQGIGIAAGKQAAIFEPFVQADSSLSRSAEGTGLGLALVKRLAELHGGSVELYSEEGVGSRFELRLPWSPEQTEPAPATVPQTHDAPPLFEDEDSAAPARPAAPKSTATPRVLVVDDKQDNIDLIADYLRLHGYRVDSALNAESALEQIRRTPPDAVLMDVQMPGMDGLEATRRLRLEPATATLPVIAVTALAMPGDAQRCLDSGANLYLSKPLSPRRVLSELNRLLER